MAYEDILFEKKDHVARVAINRPDRYNAAAPQTVHELIDAFARCAMDGEVEIWCRELLDKSPTALKMLKYAFLAETDGTTGITHLGVGALSMYYGTDEAVEGTRAFGEKRKPDFSPFRK